ncbi:MAG: MFS transporter [Bacillota bacterium]|nr:MFS transporter [Bacillota bacterium]
MRQYLKMILELPFAVKWFLMTECLFGFSIGVWNLSLNFHLKVYGLSDINIGAILSFGLFVTAFVSVLAGTLGDRIGYRPVMVIGCVVQGTGMLVIALGSGYQLFYGGQLLYGAGSAFILSSEFPFITGLVEEKFKQLVYNLLICAYLTAMVFGNILGGIFPSWFSHMKDPYLIQVAVCGILFILMGVGRSMLPSHRAVVSKRRNFSFILKDKKLLSYVLYGFIASICFNEISSMLNIVFRDRYKLPDSTIGVIYSMISILGSLAVFIVPMLVGRYKNSGIAALATIIQAISYTMMAWAGLGIFIFLAMNRAFFGTLIPGTIDSSMLQSVDANEKGAYSGMRIFANNMGMAVGSAMAGAFLMNRQYPAMMLTGGGIAFLQAVIYIFICKRYTEA